MLEGGFAQKTSSETEPKWDEANALERQKAKEEIREARQNLNVSFESKPKKEKSFSSQEAKVLFERLQASEARTNALLKDLESYRGRIRELPELKEEKPGIVASFLEPFRMFSELWKIVPPDARGSLIKEFLLYPQQFKERYEEEKRFEANLSRGWNQGQGRRR